MTTASLKKSLKRANLNREQLGDQIRASCEHVDALFKRSSAGQGLRYEELSEAFEDLFTLLEEFRLSEEELREKHHRLATLRELLETERQRYRELFEVAPDGYLVADPKATIEEANPAAAVLLQVEQPQLIGMSLFLFIDEQDLQTLRSELRGVEKGDAIRGLELRLHSRTGSMIPASVTLTTVHNTSNELVGFHCMIRNITKRRKAEEALRLSEERFRSVTESARDAIIVADSNGHIISWNRGATIMFEYVEEEVLGKPFPILMPERFKDSDNFGFLKYKNSTEVFPERILEFSCRRKDGSEFPAEISLSSWGSGDQMYFSGIIRDVSERKQSEESRARLLERLILAQEEERRWIARELHDETGQSLTSLLVGLRMIEESKTLQKAKVEANRLRQITSQTLDDLGRLARGLHPNTLDDLGLVVALNRYASDYSRSFRIKVHFESIGISSKRLPLAVEMALFRIGQEALTNVAKHAAAKNIRIVLEKQSDNVQLVLKDDGKGFEVETALRNAAASNCLGLYGMRERASLMNGSVTFDSQPGKGTRVCAQIPLSEGFLNQVDDK